MYDYNRKLNSLHNRIIALGIIIIFVLMFQIFIMLDIHTIFILTRKMYDKTNNEQIVNDKFGLIEINGGFIDEDDYSQMDYKSRTLSTDSIE